MNEERRLRYQRAKPIAMAALERAEAGRASFVASQCGGDGALYDEVCWMLEAAEATVPCEGLLPVRAPEAVGSTLNVSGSSGYRILRQLGEGGGGVVYLAERALGEGTPEELRQQVAIKVLHAFGLSDGEAQRRFAEERRILASLNHPNIAHLIDGGSTRDGRPFLALEYVEGERIDHWCERHGLSLRERVQLFLKVCAAVHYAHQHLVIHRDLKPGNILVNEAGEPKLLDFGIARLLDRVDGEAATRTRTEMRRLTLAYASPEQLRGGALGTGADVWSLGVVLYQLVCGERPFGDEDESSPLGLSTAIDTGRLLPPSRRQRTLKLRGDVPADIDAIVMKALRRDPSDRYAGADALAADLHRYLAARPVLARHGAAWYRVRLYLRRHAMAASVAGFLLVLLVSFTLQRVQQVKRLETERDKTAAIADFLQNLFENADPTHAHGSNLTVREVLDRGAVTLATRQDIAAPVRVRLLLSMGRAYNQLGLGGKAVPLLEDARRLQGDYAASALERGQVLAALGRAYSTAINLEQALPLDRQAIALLSQAPGDHALDILRVRINLLYNALGTAGDSPAGIERDTRQILATLDARQRPEPELHLQAMAVLAMAQGAQGHDAVAVASARQAMSEAQRLYVDDDPARIYYRFVLALVSLRHDPAGAMQLYHQAIADYDHQVGAAGASMAGMLTFFGVALDRPGSLDDARVALERSARLVQPLAEVSPDFQLYTLTRLAKVYVALGRPADAVGVLQPQLDRLAARKASAWGMENQATALLVLGDAALARGHAEAAARHYTAVQLALGQSGAKALPDAWGQALAGQGEVALRRGQPGQAERWLAQLTTFNQASQAGQGDPRSQAASQLQAHLRQARRVAVASCTPAAAVAAAAPSCQDAPLVAAAGAADTREASH